MDLINATWDKTIAYYRNPYNVSTSKIEARYKALSESMEIVRRGLGDNTVAVFDIARALKRIKEEELYKNFPMSDGLSRYHDFFDFVRDQFGGKKSTVYNYIAIFDRFTDNGKAKEDFKDYTYTQLVSMLPMSDSALVVVNPSWAVSRIKDYAKTCKENNENSNRLESEGGVREWDLSDEDKRWAFLNNYLEWRKEFESSVKGVTLQLYSVELTAVSTLYAMQWGNSVPCYYLSDVAQSVKYLAAKDVIALLEKEDIQGVRIDTSNL